MAERERMAALLPAYEIGGELGRGGFGTVYAARHRRLDRQVAVKVLPGEIASDPESRRRFETEARVIASFDHPHVVQVFDFVDDDELCLLVMERLDGGTSGQRFTHYGLRPEDACAIALAVADALDYAHQRGVLHRDVKPDNVLFGQSGTLRVTDFGIAKVLGMGITLATQAGMILGTPAYMSPEQAMGEDLSTASDVYSLALMLYEFLSGFTPFRSDSNPLVVLHAHAYEEPRPLLEVAPSIPAAVAAVIMAGLARHPGLRTPNAAAFGLDLAAATVTTFGPGWVGRSTISARLSPGVSEVLAGRSGVAWMNPPPLPSEPPVLRPGDTVIETPHPRPGGWGPPTPPNPITPIPIAPIPLSPFPLAPLPPPPPPPPSPYGSVPIGGPGSAWLQETGGVPVRGVRQFAAVVAGSAAALAALVLVHFLVDRGVNLPGLELVRLPAALASRSLVANVESGTTLTSGALLVYSIVAAATLAAAGGCRRTGPRGVGAVTGAVSGLVMGSVAGALVSNVLPHVPSVGPRLPGFESTSGRIVGAALVFAAAAGFVGVGLALTLAVSTRHRLIAVGSAVVAGAVGGLTLLWKVVPPGARLFPFLLPVAVSVGLPLLVTGLVRVGGRQSGPVGTGAPVASDGWPASM